MSRWRARNGEIYFEGRLFAREIENLPAIFATEAREALELGERRARAAAILEMSEQTGAEVDIDPEDL